MQQALEALVAAYQGKDKTGQVTEAITALRAALAEPKQEPVNKYCCHTCFNKSGQFFLDRMILCPKCGNKRCPKASHHDLPCTNSNEPGQEGSIYTAPTPRKPLTDEQIDHLLPEIVAGGAFTVITYGRAVARAIERHHGIGEQHE